MEASPILSSGRGQCLASLSSSCTDDTRALAASDGDNYRQGDGDASEEQGCHRCEPPIHASANIKHETAERKQCEQHMQKILQECEPQPGNERNRCSTATSPGDSAYVTVVDETVAALTSQPEASTGGKDHSRTEITFSDQWNEASYDLSLSDDTSPSHDVSRGISGCLRSGLTGINTRAENVTDACIESKQINVVKNDNIPVIDTSPETVSGKSDLTNEGEMLVVTGKVQKGVISHQGVKKKYLDSTLVNDEVTETNKIKLEEDEKRQEVLKPECPVWQILKHFECPFKWVPDVFINRSPNSVIQENIITHLAGECMDILVIATILLTFQFVR